MCYYFVTIIFNLTSDKSIVSTQCYNTMVANLCHFVLSCFRGEKAKRRHAKTRQMVTFVFSHGDLSPRHTKVRGIPCVAFSATVKFVLSLPGEAKGRHAKTRQNHHLAGFAWRPFAFSPRKHVYTTWHKSATIQHQK